MVHALAVTVFPRLPGRTPVLPFLPYGRVLRSLTDVAAAGLPYVLPQSPALSLLGAAG